MQVQDISRPVHDEQGNKIGIINLHMDQYGNLQFQAISTVRKDEFFFYTESAARFWLDIIDALVNARWVRTGRA